MLKAITETAPAAWAPYLINGDASGLDIREVIAAERWLASLPPGAEVVDCGDEPWFTWAYDAYDGDCPGGEVVEYTVLVPRRRTLSEIFDLRMSGAL